MAQSIKLGSDTYLDASGVEMRASDSTYRKTLADWADGFVDTKKFSIANGGTLTLNIANDTRAFILTNGAAQSAKRILIIHCTAASIVGYLCIPDVPSQWALTTGNNRLAITNNTSAGMQISVLINQGSVTSV